MGCSDTELLATQIVQDGALKTEAYQQNAVQWLEASVGL